MTWRKRLPVPDAAHESANRVPVTPRVSFISPPNARFDYLLAVPEGEAVGKVLSDAMRDIEKNNSSLSEVLPKTYEVFNST